MTLSHSIISWLMYKLITLIVVIAAGLAYQFSEFLKLPYSIMDPTAAKMSAAGGVSFTTNITPRFTNQLTTSVKISSTE